MKQSESYYTNGVKLRKRIETAPLKKKNPQKQNFSVTSASPFFKSSDDKRFIKSGYSPGVGISEKKPDVNFSKKKVDIQSRITISELHTLRLDKRNEISVSKIIPDAPRIIAKGKEKSDISNQAKIVELNPLPDRNKSFYNNQKVMAILRKNTPFSSMGNNIFSTVKNTAEEKPKDYLNIQHMQEGDVDKDTFKKLKMKNRFISYSSNVNPESGFPETDQKDFHASEESTQNNAFAKTDRNFFNASRANKFMDMSKSTRQFFDPA